VPLTYACRCALSAAGYRIIALARNSTEELAAASRAAADNGRGAISIFSD